jgi:hypothetical protein
LRRVAPRWDAKPVRPIRLPSIIRQSLRELACQIRRSYGDGFVCLEGARRSARVV